MTSLRRAWAALPPRLRILEPLDFSPGHWALLERMRADFNDREAHTHLPMPIARFRKAAAEEVHECARRFDDVETVNVDDGRPFGGPAVAGPTRWRVTRASGATTST
jgi:hypothetical protein